MTTAAGDSAALYVAPSTLGPHAGQGLFASRAYKRGERVVEYTGELLTREQYEQRYPNDKLGKYVLELSKNHYIDARDPDGSGPARFINDCRRSDRLAGHCGRNNVRAEVARGTKRAWLYATRPISPGEELFWNYGNSYWKQ